MEEIMVSRTIDVAEIIDMAPLSRFQIRIFVLCGLVALLDGFDAQAIAFVASALADNFKLPVTAFGPIFGAGTLGLALGAFVLPPLADRFGRRYQIVLATLIFGVFSLATVWVNSYAALAVLRFLTGIGVGAAVPNLVPLASEYAPKRMRAMLITLVTASWPLGAVVGGAISAKMIPAFGWQAVFYLSGIVPLVLVVVLLAALPESIRFMINRGAKPDRIAAMMHRIAPSLQFSAADRFVLLEESLHGFSIKHLFSDGRAAVTMLLWVPFFMNFLVLFFIFNWLPPLMQQAGLPIERAILATVVFNLGGIVGGIAMGRLMDKVGNFVVLGLAYAFAALFVGSIGLVGFSIPLLMLTVLLAGSCTVGTQMCGNALAASLYPTAVRATGVGWAYGVGRLGSIVGPILGGVLLTLHWSMQNLFLMAAIPLIFATAAIILLGRTNHESSFDAVASKPPAHAN
jgi:AAHS family 4-hydroxybenzoate transporter-like MFS transporter